MSKAMIAAACLPLANEKTTDKAKRVDASCIDVLFVHAFYINSLYDNE